MYQQRIKLAAFNAAAFEEQARGLEAAASWASSKNMGRVPDFFAMAGRLSDKQYDGLRHFLNQRHQASIPERSKDHAYSFAVRWLRQPGAAFATSEPQPANKTNKQKSAQRQKKDLNKGNDKTKDTAKIATLPSESEQAKQTDQRFLFNKLGDALPVLRPGHGGKNAIRYPLAKYETFAGQLREEEMAALRHYAKERFDLNIAPLNAEQRTAYGRGHELLVTAAKADLAPRSLVDERERRDQRTMLRQFERQLPKKSPKVSRWAGRLQPEDWQALATYMKLRYAIEHPG